MSDVALSAISLFAGGGGLDLGLERAGIARTVCRVEHEAYAAAVLAARAQDGSLDDAPVWSDVSTFDGGPWRGRVGLVFGGFPCQDISSAGAKEGIGGARSGLWREFARIIREVEPRYVFVENVADLVHRGLGDVLGDLAELGFDAEWGTIQASAVGAPHKSRNRLFVLGHSIEPSTNTLPSPSSQRRAIGEPGLLLADANEDRLEGKRVCCVCGAPGREPGGRSHALGCSRAWPPRPLDDAGWVSWLEQWPGTEPSVRRGAPGSARHVERLRLLGNGVVPAQAALAWSVLMQRMKENP